MGVSLKNRDILLIYHMNLNSDQALFRVRFNDSYRGSKDISNNGSDFHLKAQVRNNRSRARKPIAHEIGRESCERDAVGDATFLTQAPSEGLAHVYEIFITTELSCLIDEFVGDFKRHLFGCADLRELKPQTNSFFF